MNIQIKRDPTDSDNPVDNLIPFDSIVSETEKSQSRARHTRIEFRIEEPITRSASEPTRLVPSNNLIVSRQKQ